MTDEPLPTSPISQPATIEEQLVAYLDGELDHERTVQVEALLARDPGAREELIRLERTWSLLDGLERPQVDETFTRTTIEMVAVAEEEKLARERAEAPRRRRRRWLIGGAGLLGAVLAGFFAVVLLRPDPDRQLIEDLPLLLDYDEYNQIDDVEFLKMLHEQKLFTKDTPDGG
jgi:anti-sigma factor RsiW